MILDYSSETGFSQAVTDTFSGEKPCGLCKKLESLKNSESPNEKQQAPRSSPTAKLNETLFPPSSLRLREPTSIPFSEPGFVPTLSRASLTRSGPPTPPPERWAS